MTLRNTITGTLQALIELRRKHHEQLLELQRDEKYSAEYRQQLIQEAVKQFSAEAAALARPTLDSINNARGALKDGKSAIAKDRLNPERAQAFNTAARMIELAGKHLTAEDIRELSLPFADDHIALAALRGLVFRQGLSADLMPVAPVEEEGPLDMATDAISKAAGAPLDQDIGLSVVVAAEHLQKMPASVFEAPGAV